MSDIDWSQYKKGQRLKATFGNGVKGEIEFTLYDEVEAGDFHLLFDVDKRARGYDSIAISIFSSVEVVEEPIIPGDWGVDPNDGQPAWVDDEGTIESLDVSGITDGWTPGSSKARAIVWHRRNGKLVQR